MILIRENRSPWRKSFRSATLYTKNTTWTDLGLNLGLHSQRLAINCLSHGMAFKAQITAKQYIHMWCGYKITELMLEHLLFKKFHNRNVVTLNVLPSAIPTPLHANFPLLEAVLQVVF